MKPIIFFEHKYTQDEINNFKKSNKIWRIVDIYENQLNELYEIRNPYLIHSPHFLTKRKNFITNKIKRPNGGDYIYFPWNGNFIHSVNEDEYYELRTNRNKNLITDSEQLKLRKAIIGFVGLSVGLNSILALTYLGIGKKLKISDFDKLSTTNLNRIKAGIADIGLSKSEIAMRQIYEINPYMDINVFDNGLNDDNLDEYLTGEQKMDIIFEMVDDFKLKIKIRLGAKRAGIPVVMLTNLGDSVLVDVERYDLEPELPLFNGILKDLPDEILINKKIDAKKYAAQIVGIENIPERALNSLAEIGRTLVGRPQLFNTLSVSSGIGAFIVRKIVLNHKLNSGRYIFKVNDLFNE